MPAPVPPPPPPPEAVGSGPAGARKARCHYSRGDPFGTLAPRGRVVHMCYDPPGPHDAAAGRPGRIQQVEPAGTSLPVERYLVHWASLGLGPKAPTWQTAADLCCSAAYPSRNHVGRWHPDLLAQMDREYLPSVPLLGSDT